MNILWFLIGFASGGVIVWLITRTKAAITRKELETKLEDAQKAQQQLSQTFDSLAASALSKNNESFLQLANQALATRLTQAQGDLDLRKQAVESMIKPIKESLNNIEKERLTAYAGFKNMSESLVKSQETLAKETRNLVTALRTPWVRGHWGESTLRRVAELVGMIEHCDFTEQTSIESDGVNLRPDMIVYLPNERQVVVDAKTPLEAYLQAIEADNDESKAAALDRHAQAVRNHCDKLAAKSYWAPLSNATEFVVLFLPGEPFLATALQRDPALLEDAMSKRVVLATPSSLFCLLHVISHGWRQEQLADNARRIGELGREIHDRIADWAGHLTRLGDALEKAVGEFNRGIGSLESRVLVSARRFKDLGILSEKDIPETPQIDTTLREPPKLDNHFAQDIEK